jgi:hypothetical protein
VALQSTLARRVTSDAALARDRARRVTSNAALAKLPWSIRTESKSESVTISESVTACESAFTYLRSLETAHWLPASRAAPVARYLLQRQPGLQRRVNVVQRR